MKYNDIGGEDVTSAVTSVFAALLWHTQSLRDDVEKIGMYWNQCGEYLKYKKIKLGLWHR